MTRNGITTALLGIVVIVGRLDAGRRADVTDARIQELIRAAAERIGARPGGHGRRRKQAPAAAPGAVVHMSLDDAVKLALDRNLDIAVQRLNPQTFDFSHRQPAVGRTSRPSPRRSANQSAANPPTNDLAGRARRRQADRRNTTDRSTPASRRICAGAAAGTRRR